MDFVRDPILNFSNFFLNLWCFCYLLFPHQTGWSPERLSTYFYDFLYELLSSGLSYFSFRSLCRQHDFLSIEQQC